MIMMQILGLKRSEAGGLWYEDFSFFLLIVLAGFIVVSMFPDTFGFNAHYITLPFRGGMMLWSGYFFWKHSQGLKKIRKEVLWILIFWAYWTVKTIYTLQNYSFDPEGVEAAHQMLPRIGIIILPVSLCLVQGDYAKLDTKWLTRKLFLVFLITQIISGLYSIFVIETLGKSPGIFAAYYISTGHYGLSLILISFFLFFRSDLDISKIWSILGMGVGLFTLAISSARSPVLAAFVVFPMLFFILRKRYLIGYLVLIGILGCGMLYLGHEVFHWEWETINRVYVGVFEGNFSGREYYWNEGWNIFKNNPWVGGRTLLSEGSYPHNLFLELLMGGGLLGGIIFLKAYAAPILQPIFSKKKTNLKNLEWVPIMLMQYFILTLTSYNLYGSYDFVYLAAFWIGMQHYTQLK